MSMFNNNNYNSSSSQFGGSQIGGGGFMNNNENFNSSNKPQSNRAVIPYDQRKLSQITIKQIKTAPPIQPDENLKIDGVDISQVSMIAQIVSIDIQTSHTTLKINDFTGTLDAKKWTNDNQPQSMGNDDSMNLVEGRWVKIIGRINHYAGRCSINVFEIIPITDFNDITHHFLECVYAHLEYTVGHLNPEKKQRQQQSNNNMNDQSNYNQNNQNNNNNNNNNNYYGNNTNSMNMGMGMNNNNNGLPVIQNKILQVINVPEYENSDAGCNVEIIFQKLSGEDVNAIRDAIDQLSDAGYIYSTVDDEHYKYSGDQN
mmetsp:Transcript_45041/g.40296  ORF Transcript_45041/g.40296 Transcript_45041/m.40296 type:complete len:314 (+) Transcript_45041:131-1072(+)